LVVSLKHTKDNLLELCLKL